MNVFQITVPIYAETEEEAVMAQKALFGFVDGCRQRKIAVTGRKVVAALEKLETNQFVRVHVDNFLIN